MEELEDQVESQFKTQVNGTSNGKANGNANGIVNENAVALLLDKLRDYDKKVVAYNKTRNISNLFAIGIGTSVALISERPVFKILGAAWAGMGVGSYLGRTMAISYLIKTSVDMNVAKIATD